MTTILQHGDDVPQGDSLPPEGATVLSDGTYLVRFLIPTDTAGGNFDAIWLQRYAADGTKLGDPVDSNAFEAFDTLRIIPLAEGYLVADRLQYQGNPDGTYYADFFSVFSADGHPISTYNRVTSYLASVPTVTVLDNGDILFSWLFGTIGNFALYHPDGTIVSHQTFRSFVEPSATALSGGHFVEEWFGIDGRGHSETFDASGHAVSDFSGPPVGAAARLHNGGFVSTSTGYNTATAMYYLLAYTYDAAGLSVSGPVLVGGFSGNPETHIAPLGDGGFVVAWRAGDSTGAANGIYIRRFDDTGHALGSPVLVNKPAMDLELLSVVADADGGVAVNWRGTADGTFERYQTVFSATADMTGANLLFGTSGNDSLDGRQGADIMAGGTGNDTYYVDNAGDQVQEVGSAGTDWVFSTITYTLGADVENLTLRGTADIDGSGNALANRIGGNAGANHLFGGAGNDDLRALGGNDTLSGNSGADTMYGGAGDDLYYADDTGDRAYEILGGTDTGGIDTVRASATFNLSIYVENLILVGTADINGFGTELANTLTGNSGVNALFGMAGNDVINGGAGADRMYGGTGNDTFYVDNTGDQVFEADGEGTDIVFSSVSYATGNQYVDHITLTGTADINATGNILANRITGNAGANTLSGLAGADRLNGGAGNDTLIGGSGADVFVFSQNSGADQINDFLAVINDRIDISAYSGGVVNGGGVVITQVGADTIIDLGGGNTVTVLHTVAADVTSHIIW